MFYLLADGIYPDLLIFLKTLSDPQTAKHKLFAKNQESFRKDIERCFGVLFARFHILANPSLQWSSDMMKLIWKCCIILHNMIIEDEEELDDLEDAENVWGINVDRQHSPILSYEKFKQYSNDLRDKDQNVKLRDDIIEHMWSRQGNQ